ncbi:unnamed protein product [Polarella glacialis]|uniref:Uncharacterized protein n=1 Tax=Polarella glacialis TaxID=89957 RepID=A0A813IJD5_POLGL|nr:unnamed protein product [Polarella glacialis]CAE8652063.1 unnamed protein product [Polarella glacialis]
MSLSVSETSDEVPLMVEIPPEVMDLDEASARTMHVPSRSTCATWGKAPRILMTSMGLLGVLGLAAVGTSGSGSSTSGFLGNFISLQATTTASCLSNEEMYEGLCYQQCRILTQGEANYRRGTDTCCQANSFMCSFVKTMVTKSAGLAIGGGQAVESQVHAPGVGGDCLPNEEPLIGVCYKKCSNLTNGTHPFRTGSSSCCGGTAFSCILGKNASEVLTNVAYSSGGGTGPLGVAHFPSDLTQLVVNDGYIPPQHCLNNEETFMKMCYKSCSLLTFGKMPYRKGADTCCSKTGFSSFVTCLWPTNYDVNLQYAVGGGQNFNSQPHLPGMAIKCLDDEELFAGLCYKKCSILTGGVAPYRMSVMSCCMLEAATACGANMTATVATPGFDIGGDMADGAPHNPYLKN